MGSTVQVLWPTVPYLHVRCPHKAHIESALNPPNRVDGVFFCLAQSIEALTPGVKAPQMLS